MKTWTALADAYPPQSRWVETCVLVDGEATELRRARWDRGAWCDYHRKLLIGCAPTHWREIQR